MRIMKDNKAKMNRGTLAGIVLAAGMSSRMGGFKPLMKVGGKPMIQRVVDMMQQAGASPIIVVTGRCAESLMAELKNEDVLFVHNTDYEHTQMFDSLLLGIHALPESAERILMSPVDVPVVNRKTVEKLLNSPGMFVRPVFRGTPGHPAVFSRELISKMERYTAQKKENELDIVLRGLCPLNEEKAYESLHKDENLRKMTIRISSETIGGFSNTGMQKRHFTVEKGNEDIVTHIGIDT